MSDRGGVVAYFTMEVALDDALPTYSGGLGVLAGDYLRSAADLGLPLVCVTLLYRSGYFIQHVDGEGRQHEEPVSWSPTGLLEPLEEEVTLELGGRPVRVGAWRLELRGEAGGSVLVYFLDTDREGNDTAARAVTDQLYSGDEAHRLEQEAVLGLGGVEMLRRLGHEPAMFHMNEGHSSLLVLRLLEEQERKTVRSSCVFTTHTPVPAGHDRFGLPVAETVLGPDRIAQLADLGLLEDKVLNMTELGIAGSGFVNAVSVRHRGVTRAMFPGTAVSSITNGVHAGRWTGPAMAAVFDRHLAGWRLDNALLRYASELPAEEIELAHDEAKRRLLEEVASRADRELDPAALTIGLARRATPYKQTTLLFSDLDELTALADAIGPLQVVSAGKAHPRDFEGKKLIGRLVELSGKLTGPVSVVFLEQYDLRLASLLVAGADVWLNTPSKPNEASGTSGMKAALNGVPSLSTLDGWWLEGCIDGVTGWAVGSSEPGDDAGDLYRVLAEAVLPSYYGERDSLTVMRRRAIALNGSFFNTERMARQYAREAYGMSALSGR